MKKIKRLQDDWRKIKLIDQYLIIIMVILILYSMSTIFFGKATTDFSGNVDVIMRTMIASIFGYFISSNFAKSEYFFDETTKIQNTYVEVAPIELSSGSEKSSTEAPGTPEEPPLIPSSKALQHMSHINISGKAPAFGKIGFAMDEPSKTGNAEKGTAVSTGTARTTRASGHASSNNLLQIRVIGILCICSILTLICLRYVINATANENASLSQFRDIVCGSIGFLIGMPGDHPKR